MNNLGYKTRLQKDPKKHFGTTTLRFIENASALSIMDKQLKGSLQIALSYRLRTRIRDELMKEILHE